MGFVLSVLYFVTYYLTPATIFGPLAAIRIELILAVLLLLISLPALVRSFALKTPQSLALIGLAFATFLSVLIQARWPGGAVQALLGFIPNTYAFFLVCFHCNSRKRLQAIVFVLLVVCLFVIAHGSIALLDGVPSAPQRNMDSLEPAPLPLEATTIPYLLPMRNDAGNLIYRLRGMGEIQDPNDLGQLIVCVIPLVFIFWRPKRLPRNLVLVILPVCALLYGTFLTHSRGALLALAAVAVVAARRRIGTLPALLIACAVFAAAMALHFTGGRGISVEAGSDRAELWSDGLQLLKSHPLFGVGLGRMPDFTDSHRTAHNSVLVCAAELGVFGLYFWSLFLFSTLRDALAISSPGKVSEGEPIPPEDAPFPLAAKTIAAVDKADVNRLGRLLV
jgi:hypothetical protein